MSANRNAPAHLPAVILRDGLPVYIATGGEFDVLAWMRGQHSFSLDHATRHEGYRIVTADDSGNPDAPSTPEGRALLIRAWQDFHTMATRRGYGIPGALARLAVSIQDLVHEYDQQAAKWADAPAGLAANWDRMTDEREHIAGMLAAFVGLLGYTGPDAGLFDVLRGELDAWARATAARIGADGEAL